jgi:FkbM family methyltransferase
MIQRTLPPGQRLNCFLQSRAEIDAATQEIRDLELIEHDLSCKNFDIMRILERIKDGNFCDLGADGSYILQNLVHIGHKGLKYGIDLGFKEDYKMENGIEYFKGDLMHTPFPSGTFSFLTCLSVIEHQVSLSELAIECSRLLVPNGELFITCDYWNPKVDTTAMKLYGLDWNILCKQDVLQLIQVMAEQGLQITSETDWTTNEDVINPRYCSPYPVSYTFGIFHFVKRQELKVSHTIANFFPQNEHHTLVEVGAGHPVELSVSFPLRSLDWNIISIEPIPEFCQAHQKRNFTVLHYAAYFEDKGIMNFQVSPNLVSCSALENRFENHAGWTSNQFKTIQVETVTVNTILGRHYPNLTLVDALSINVEGWELEVLQGFDFGKFKPKFVRLKNARQSFAYADYMETQGYKLNLRDIEDEFYIRL